MVDCVLQHSRIGDGGILTGYQGLLLGASSLD
jgi:hypothetical protein